MGDCSTSSPSHAPGHFDKYGVGQVNTQGFFISTFLHEPAIKLDINIFSNWD
jgi:hypothetical protein